MKVLFVTTNNYPYNGTCSNIINNLINVGKLDTKISKIDILCSKNDYNENDYSIINGIGIYRTFSWTLINRKKFLSCFSKHPIISIKGFIFRLYNFLVKKIIKSNFIDYPTYFSFLRKIRKININKYDVIISISGRYDASIAICKYLKNKNNKFIIYQVDPLSTSKIYNSKSLKKRQLVEYELYKRANYIVTTPIIMYEHLKTKNNIFNYKMISMEFPVIIPNSLLYKNKNKTIIKCMFLGTLYGGARNPIFTFDVFSLLFDNSIQLHLVGVDESDIPLKYKINNIVCYGRQNIEQCKKLIREADFLVNIGNSLINQIPSKIFEYISTGKPIINFCESEKCPSIKILNKYPEAINIIKGKDTVEIQAKMLKSFIYKKHKYISNDLIKKNFLTNTPEYCSMQLLEIINKLINEVER